MTNDITAAMESWLLEEEAKEAEKEAEEAKDEAAEDAKDEAAVDEETKEEGEKLDEEGAECGAAMRQLAVKEAEIRRMMTYVAKRGIDRAFVELCNHDNILNDAFKIPFAGAESYDVVGSPSSQISMEAFKGLKKGLDKVKNFAKQIGAKALNFAKMAWAWIRKVLLNLAHNIKKVLGMKSGKVEKLLANAKADLADLKIINKNLKNGQVTILGKTKLLGNKILRVITRGKAGVASIEEDFSADTEASIAGMEGFLGFGAKKEEKAPVINASASDAEFLRGVANDYEGMAKQAAELQKQMEQFAKAAEIAKAKEEVRKEFEAAHPVLVTVINGTNACKKLASQAGGLLGKILSKVKG